MEVDELEERAIALAEREMQLKQEEEALTLAHKKEALALEQRKLALARHKADAKAALTVPSPLALRSRASDPVIATIRAGKRSRSPAVLHIPSVPSAPATPTNSESTESQYISSNDGEVEASINRKRRSYRSKKLSGLHSASKPSIYQRREWLQSARGEKSQPITHRLQGIPPFYHPSLDEHSALDSLQVLPVPREWEATQPEVRNYCTEVIKYHVYKSDKNSNKCPSVKQEEWEAEYSAAIKAGWVSPDLMSTPPPNNWKITYPMPDNIYIELVKLLVHPTPRDYLGEIKASDPQMYKVVRRQVEEHGRYQIFWGHVEVFIADRPSVRYSRLLPILYRVEAGCHKTVVEVSDCKRCLPLSQISLMLDSYHSGGSHQKDAHHTISLLYCGVLRQSVRLFAAKCHVCNRTEKKTRNKRPPRAIAVSEVRQRYTLDCQ